VCWTSAAKNGSIVSDDTVQTGKFNDLIEQVQLGYGADYYDHLISQKNAYVKQ
jgi:hypothetical protein